MMVTMGSPADAVALSGLSDAEAARRFAADGPNELPTSAPRTLVAIAAEVLREPMLLLLLATGAIYLAIGSLEEALALLGAIFVVIGITLVQERKTERTLHALRDLSSPRALVVRGGETRRIAGREVVRGDVALLQEGDRVPADAAVVSATNLCVDESLLTGESVPVRKVVLRNSSPAAMAETHVYSGTLVISGHGVTEVTATGSSTEFGKIGRTLADLDVGPTALQREVGVVVRLLALLGLSACIALALLYGIGRGEWLSGALAGLTMAISMVPEEFPVILTIFLALGAWRISQSHVLTRRFPAIETLGSATVLCVDKTGTLTMNRMRVAAVDAEGNPEEVGAEAALSKGSRTLIEFGMLASQPQATDPMDRALGDAADEIGATRIRDESTLVHEYPLTDACLAVANVWHRPESTSSEVALKGAPEAVVQLCRLRESEASEVLRRVGRMAAQGLRVLGVARAIAHQDLPETLQAHAFEFLGLVGLADPVRPGVPAAVRECHDAGIRVVMLTGDYPETALAVARQIGIDVTGGCVTGAELVRMSENHVAGAVKSVNVFARIVPEQKLRLVRALKADREVVAMTGDGVNDAPALKAADIGVAMGSRGTDVAREAAALVLLDDDFTSIVRAVRLGRRIYDNIRKAMGYVLAIHVPIAGMSLLPPLIGGPLVLMPLHVIFMEMIVDPACSIAFELEAEEGNIMRRRPRDTRARLFNARFVFQALMQGSGMLAVTFGVYWAARFFGLDDRDVRTLAFTTLIITNLMLIFANRSELSVLQSRGLSSNRALAWLVAGATAMLAAALFIPPVRELFFLSRLHALDLAACATAGFVAILWLEILKLLTRSAGIPPAAAAFRNDLEN